MSGKPTKCLRVGVHDLNVSLFSLPFGFLMSFLSPTVSLIAGCVELCLAGRYRLVAAWSVSASCFEFNGGPTQIIGKQGRGGL